MPKTKEMAKRGIDEGASRIREQMKDSSGRSDEYGDKIEDGARDIAGRAESAAEDIGGKVKDKVSEKIKDRLSERVREKDTPKSEPDSEPAREHDIRTRSDAQERDIIKTKENYIQKEAEAPTTASDSPQARQTNVSSRGYRGGRELAQKQAQARSTGKGTIRIAEKGAVKTAEKGTVKTAEAAGKGTVKATKTGVKTAERTAKTSAKAAKATAKAAQKTAQAAAKAAKAAAQAAAKAAKLAAKAIATAVKAIIAAIKGLIAAIAAGGWVAVVIILAIALVAFILCACFGVFASNETGEEGTKPMTEAIIEIDTGFKAGIDSKIAELSAGDYDEVTVEYAGDMDGDSSYLINWNDVIAVYAVTVTMDEEAATEVVEVTPEKIEKLKEIFNDMNTVTYETEVVETEEATENESGEEATVTHHKLIIHVDVKSLDYLAAADLYGFDKNKREALEAMMEPRMLPLYAELTGIDIYGGYLPGDLTDIISGLPAGRMGSDVLKAALTKVGAPYVLGAKGPNKFDCSGLVYWAINEIDPALGRNLYTSAGYQYKYCRDNGYLVGESELQPGDIIFWHKPSCRCGAKYAEVHHTGFYLGDGMILDASSSNGRVIIRKLFDSGSYQVLAYARPYSY